MSIGSLTAPLKKGPVALVHVMMIMLMRALMINLLVMMTTLLMLRLRMMPMVFRAMLLVDLFFRNDRLLQ